MVNLRVVSVEVVNSTTINAQFTDALDPAISIDNFIIESQVNGVPSPQIIECSVSKNIITLIVQPITPQSAYLITFQSTDEQPFQSINATSLLYEDGVTNKYLIIGPTETNNPVRQFLEGFLDANIYNATDKSTLVSKLIDSLSVILSKALYDIKQIKNENYISFNVVDELKIRGEGPFDRLNEEGAYEIVRVGRAPTGSVGVMSVSESSFPYFPISLQAQSASESILASSSDNIGTFNINNFILNLSNQNVSKLKSITFFYSDARDPFVYDIETLGYQILNSKYDQYFAFSYATLLSNQIKLSESILSDELFSTENIFNIQISYEYINLGVVVNKDSVVIETVLSSTRETLPSITNVFYLKNAPITNASGDTVTTGAVSFIDPNASSTSALHPAFRYELPYSLSALPYSPGQYSIDYSTGTVYVFGADATNNGTGPYPPLATYKYVHTYKSSIDYALDEDKNDVVALPFGSLIDNAGTLKFNYEQVLIPGVDYNASAHIEELSERIGNKLVALNALVTKNSPITNVFRIYNETSGEIYGISRWSDNKIYFDYKIPPNIQSRQLERASFKNNLNEILFVNEYLLNTSSIRILKCLLTNNKLIAQSEDCISSSINSCATFSDQNVFKNEKWWDGSGIETQLQNLDRLTDVGQYQIDYENGVVFVAVDSGQSNDLGTISYKYSSITPEFPHVISVDDIYNRISLINPKDKTFSYINFSDGSIVPSVSDISDEAFLNSNTSAAYQIKDGEIGAFVDATFVPNVTDAVKFVRGLFEYNDLQNSTYPLNFSESCVSSGNAISVSAIERQDIGTVLFDDGYYVTTSLNLPYISPNLTISFSVIRSSDSAELWDSGGTVVAGETLTLELSGVNSPQLGDSVTIIYSIEINDLSRVIVDYNKGDYYIDYSYLADEIIVSYEYGENLIDFRQGNLLNFNDEYYVTYKVGALRDALLKNFGTLINIPELSTFDVDLDRERYRDAVTGALESFIVGPTISAMKKLVQTITHVEPEIIESAFQNWSLGSSLLNPVGIETSGSFELSSAKYGSGVVVNSPDQSITFPITSNLKIEEGSFQAWVMPEWNGIDNDVPLDIFITRDGYTVDSTEIFIGASEYHPEYVDDHFSVDKNTNSSGQPNKNKHGIFIYYDFDSSNLFKKWFFEVVDGYGDGYHEDGYTHNYVVKINTPGIVYDVKSLQYPQPASMTIQSGKGNITFKINSNIGIDDGISFIADRNHYLFDFGRDINKERFSIFKDPSGYLNFKVIDKSKTSYIVSADVSSWQANELHHIAASWKLNTKNSRDEIHLFIDGMEVPNIIRYGNKVGPYLHEKFRTVNPEEIAGVITKNIVGSNDLETVAGDPEVFSSLDFSAYGVEVGDTLYIDESGFNTSGYTIIARNGNYLTLDSNMPLTLSDVGFSANRATLTVDTEISLFPNIAVSTLSHFYSHTDLVTTAASDVVTSAATDFDAIDVQPGYLIRIEDGYFENHYVILSVSGNTLVLNDDMPQSFSNLTFYIYNNDLTELNGVRALRPDYSISQDGYFQDQLTISNGVSSNDLIFINTLGINHKKIKQSFYQWGDDSNIIKTRMATPISLDTLNINHIILPNMVINSVNSTDGYGVFTSDNFTTEQPSVSDEGRTLYVKISSSNVTFPVNVNIDGYVDGYSTIETLIFNDLEPQNTLNKFESINYVNASGSYINANKSFITLYIKEAFPITYSENSTIYPAIRYSYQVKAGTTLSSSISDTVTDGYGFFSSLDVDNYIVISSPGGAAGTYKILSVSDDNLSAVIDGYVPAFTSGVYQVLNTTSYRSGFQNGYFVLEEALNPGEPYLLKQGTYEFDFYTYTSIKFDPLNVRGYIGSSFSGEDQFNGVIDEVKITSNMLTDTRVGEEPAADEETITRDYNSLKEQIPDINTLFLSHFNYFPFENVAPYYIAYENKEYIQSGVSVNSDFSKSIFISDKPFIIENNGILNSKEEGTIEFWVNPLYDTQNDPNYRYYFDASGVQIENVTSLNDVTLQLNGRADKILSVTLQAGDPSVDYFAGGKIEFGTSGAISETATSTNANTVSVSRKILQVITVKAVGDKTQMDYFSGGAISTDKSTIFLGKTLPNNTTSLIITYKPLENSADSINAQVIRLNKKLPNQNMPVTVTYIPSGLKGDRISIFKDTSGYINFAIKANDIDYVVRSPAFWSKNSWHRVKASYSVNGGKNTDTLRLFVDGYERGNIVFGSGLTFGGPHVFGSSYAGLGSGIQTNIKVKDFFANLYVGSDFTKNNSAYALIDNLRISNIARPLFKPFNESLDVNYNSNLNVVFPVTSDLYTTFLLDFESLFVKNDDFIMLSNKKSGIFDFKINIFDSFGYIGNSAKVKNILETLINVLKPANSRAFLKYIK